MTTALFLRVLLLRRIFLLAIKPVVILLPAPRFPKFSVESVDSAAFKTKIDKNKQNVTLKSMTTEQFLNSIQEVLELDDVDIKIDDDFRAYEEWDSLTFLSLVTYMRDEYGVVLDIDSFNKISTWNDLYLIIAK